jgi:hypothetical protein
MGAIDRNRGGVQRSTPSGIKVFEYSDEPGVYYTMKGVPVSDEIASEARFDVEAGRKERRRRELYDEAREKADRQVEEEMEKIDQDGGAPATNVPPPAGTNLSMVHRGGGRYEIQDPEGNSVLDGTLTKKEAKAFLAEMGQEEE